MSARAWRSAVLCLGIVSSAVSAEGKDLDLDALWVRGDPVASESRFREARKGASGDEALILDTQIARTYVLRREFETAQRLLEALRAAASEAGPEARARFHLELGRSYASHQHSTKGQTDETKRRARKAYEEALRIADAHALDALAVDALHMFAFVDTAPAQQLHWTGRALKRALDSDQPDARRWEASLRSNFGEAYFDMERYTDALKQFRRAEKIHLGTDDWPRLRDARWHVARTMRMLGRIDEALEIQLDLEKRSKNDPRHYIYKELRLLYEARGEHSAARRYLELGRGLRTKR